MSNIHLVSVVAFFVNLSMSKFKSEGIMIGNIIIRI